MQHATGARLPAIDWMRGWVMVLMMLDHASAVFNGGRVADESAWLQAPQFGDAPAAQFLTRWVTHLCAPTFVFLAGTSLALSIERRLAAGQAPASVDRRLVGRGLFIAALDPLWMSFAVLMPVLQVLYAIGLSLALMALLRRVRTDLLVGGALLFLAGQELLVSWLGLGPAAGARFHVPGSLLLVPGLAEDFSFGRSLVILYPLLPWLAVLVLGWGFGRWLVAWRRRQGGAEQPERLLLAAGLLGLGLFAVLRVLGGYGNLWQPRFGSGWQDWLRVGKYPPSLAFAASQLGLMAVLLAGLFRLQRSLRGPVRESNPLLVFGRSALFFYVIHIHLVGFLALAAFGGLGRAGLLESYVGGLLALFLLYGICRRFLRYKSAHPRTWVRFF